jgi:Tfp pilus assembly protein PilF
VGSTGLGKTSMAIALSEISSNSQNRVKFPYNLYSFHMETKVDDIFGTFSINEGHPAASMGLLSKAMEDVIFLIADEFSMSCNQLIHHFQCLLLF